MFTVDLPGEAACFSLRAAKIPEKSRRFYCCPLKTKHKFFVTETVVRRSRFNRGHIEPKSHESCVAYRVYAFVQMKEILTDHFEQL